LIKERPVSEPHLVISWIGVAD